MASLIFSASAFAAAEYNSRNNPDRTTSDAALKSQSADQRSLPAGARKGERGESNIQGVACVNDKGLSLNPNDAGYTKCVDQANRVK